MKVQITTMIEASWARLRYDCAFNDSMRVWIDEHVKSDWALWQNSIGDYKAFLIWFEDRSDAVLFKLTWGSDGAIER